MKKRIILIALALVLLVGLIAVPSAVAANGAPKVLMCFLLDSSGSIGSSQWGIMLDGLKAAVNNPVIMPRDGSLEICIVQFSSAAEEELAPTIVTDASVPTIIAAINAINKLSGCTALGAGINQSVTTMQKSNNFTNAGTWKVINIATDGEPNIPGNCSDVDQGRAYAEICVTAAVAAGIQEIDVEGITTGDDQNAWMAFSIVVPDGVGGSSGPIVPPAAYPPRPGGIPSMGFVADCDDFEDYADAVDQKLILILKGQLSLEPPTATNKVNTEHCVTATLLDGSLQPVPGATITFAVTGVNPGGGTAVTDAAGKATWCYTGTNIGADTIVATAADPSNPTETLTSNPVDKTWTENGTSQPPPEVGGDIGSVSKTLLIIPIVVLAGALMAVIGIVIRRRAAQK